MIIRKFFFGLIGIAIYLSGTYLCQFSQSSFLSLFNSAPTEVSKATDQNTIQVALLLDTSSSMSGLIEQAKSQLWNILNELSRTGKDGEDTALEIALYEYGNPGKATSKYQINQLTGFTSDMDLVSEKLFSLTTNGGEEYCGAIIKTSLDDLEWRDGNNLKLIYIAGNEKFSQGPISYTTSCQNAIENGITINTIYCGNNATGIRDFWQAGALAGQGDYLTIEHNQETVYIPTPYDDKIKQLNSELNKTYIPYGEKGKAKKENQRIQDNNAGKYSKSNMVDRTAFKSSKNYMATDWDLVDAYQKDKSVLKDLKIHTDSLQNLSIEELEIKIKFAATRRSSINQQIQDLDKKRRIYKANNNKNEKESSLQKSMIETIKKQAKQKGYESKE